MQMAIGIIETEEPVPSVENLVWDVFIFALLLRVDLLYVDKKS